MDSQTGVLVKKQHPPQKKQNKTKPLVARDTTLRVYRHQIYTRSRLPLNKQISIFKTNRIYHTFIAFNIVWKRSFVLFGVSLFCCILCCISFRNRETKFVFWSERPLRYVSSLHKYTLFWIFNFGFIKCLNCVS